MNYKVDKGVDVPTEPRRGRPSVYPFASLAIGDSFTVPINEALKARLSAAQRKRLYPGWDYASRTEGDVVRIWRIS